MEKVNKIVSYKALSLYKLVISLKLEIIECRK